MTALISQDETSQTPRAQADRAELAERIVRVLRDDGRFEALEGLSLVRVSTPTGRIYSVAEPSFCVIIQGTKQIFLGSERYVYDPAHYLLTTVDLPVVSQVHPASNEQPYLSIRMRLEPTSVGAVLAEANTPAPHSHEAVKAIDVNRLDANLLDALLRLVKLVEAPADARVLAPMITREIIYRLLSAAHGPRLRHIALLGGDSHRMAKAVDLLRRNFQQPLRIERLAQELGMSVSGLHHQFKAVTTLSPLQYQKRLRLQEARRLMYGEHLDAASAGFRVGYDDAAHFNREYKSLFGLPPIRDVERLREATSTGTLSGAVADQ